MKYEFNPEDYGYEHISKFPELIKFMNGMLDTTYIKVIAVISNNDALGRNMYWYSRCYKIADTDRWDISSNSYDINKASVAYEHKPEYSSLITSESFAENLLTHIFSGCMVDSFHAYGKSRLVRNINTNRFDGNNYD